MDILLHHYDLSPFAEPVRRAFGLKDMAWRSVLVSPIPPRPKQLPLTGGYRRTPIAQVGADIYCDSQLIFELIERRRPSPALFPAGWRLLHNALSRWVLDVSVDVIKLRYAAWPSGGPDLFYDFIRDRRAMNVDAFDIAAIGSEAEALKTRLGLFASWVDDELKMRNPFLQGGLASIVDLRVFQGFWFADAFIPDVKPSLAHYPRFEAWMERMKAIGHGTREEMSDDEALALARASEPVDIAPELGPEAQGFALGERVLVHADDYGFEKTEGELVKLTPTRISLLREDPQAGRIAVHFPRFGFAIERVREALAR